MMFDFYPLQYNCSAHNMPTHANLFNYLEKDNEKGRGERERDRKREGENCEWLCIFGPHKHCALASWANIKLNYDACYIALYITWASVQTYLKSAFIKIL